MIPEQRLLTDPRIRAALEELQGLILGRYPAATLSVGLGDDPEGVYLRPVVDVEDRGEVVDVFINRLVDLQVDEGLPLYVVLGRPPERNAAILRARAVTPASATVASP